MKEIEVKAQVENVSKLIEKIKELGCNLSVPLVQKDIVYLQNGIELSDVKRGNVAMRIRNSNGICTLNLKKQMENELDCVECETIIEDPKQTHEILVNMGYHEVSRVEKTRRTCMYQKMNICVDEVLDLGNFIEVETLSEDADSLKTQEELFQFLESLGLKRQDRIFKGYDTLMHERKNAQ